MEFRELDPTSDAYAPVLQLRREVLRWPLGLEYSLEDLRAEHDQIHLVGYENEHPVAVALLKWRTPQVAQMRQVAVASSRQGTGVGRQLVAEFEAVVQRDGGTEIKLHARESAVPFYSRLGYETYDEPFEEVGIPHRKMRKFLTSTPG